jgi:hypothetical protein
MYSMLFVTDWIHQKRDWKFSEICVNSFDSIYCINRFSATKKNIFMPIFLFPEPLTQQRLCNMYTIYMQQDK